VGEEKGWGYSGAVDWDSSEYLCYLSDEWFLEAGLRHQQGEWAWGLSNHEL